MAVCKWSDGQECEIIIELTGQPVKCNGRKRACLGRMGTIIDVRDRVPVQLRLRGLEG